MNRFQTTLALLAIGVTSALSLGVAADYPPPHARPLAGVTGGVSFTGDTLLLEAEGGEGGWERIDDQGTKAIRAVTDAKMVYRLRFDAAGTYYLHLRCHHAGGTKDAAGVVQKGESTNDAVVTFGGAPLYGSDKVTRPVGMRCHSKEFRWWALPKGPGAHTPPPIKDKPVQLWVPEAGSYELVIGYRSPGLVIDRIAITRTPQPPQDRP